MKKAFLFIAALAMSTMMWADVTVDTILLKGFAGSESTSYVSELLTGSSQNGITVAASNFNPSTSQIKGNQTSATGNFYIYNTDAYPAAITKIEIIAKIDANNYFKNNMYAATGTTSQAEVTDVAVGVAWNLETASWTFDEADGVTFFKLYSNEKFTNGSVKEAKVVVTYGGEPAPQKEVVDVQLTGEPTKMEYFVGESFDPAGLIVTAKYNDESFEDVTSKCTWIIKDADWEDFTTFEEVTENAEVYVCAEFEIRSNTRNFDHIVVKAKPAPVGGNTIVMEDYQQISFTTSDGAYTVLADKAGAGNVPVYNENGKDLRIYAKGTFTLTSNNGNMTQIAFNISTQGLKRQAEITPSAGAMAYDMDNKVVTWTGDAAEVTFTVGETATYGSESTKAGQFCFVSIEITLGGTPTPGPTANPTAPTVPANQVKAVYSATYSADCGFGDWGSGTTYAQETYGKKFTTTNLGYFGLVDFNLNCSKMEGLRMAVYSEEEMSLRVVPIHGGTEVGVTKNITANQWNYIDIALTEFTGVTDWSGVYQIKIDNASNRTFWLNDIYFYTSQAPQEDEDAPENFTAEVNSASYGSVSIVAYAEDASGEIIYTVKESGAVITTANGVSGMEKTFTVTGLESGKNYSLLILASDPYGNVADGISLDVTTLATPAGPEAPDHEAKDVMSIYSDHYDAATSFNVGSWGQTTVSEAIKLADGGNAYYLSNANYLGWEFGSTISVSDMKYVSFAVYPLAGTSIEFTPIWGSELLKKVEGLKEGEWNVVTISLDDYTGINKENIYQLKWANMPSSMFLTDVFFYRDSDPSGIREAIINANVRKAMVNGRLIIVKGEKAFDLQGRIVK